jgi:NADH-quinone oxidoreductase subunit I
MPELDTIRVRISVLPGCVDCALCVLSCPVDCLGFDQARRRLVVLEESPCIVCLNCEDACPVDAIRIGLRRYLPGARPV